MIRNAKKKPKLKNINKNDPNIQNAFCGRSLVN